MKLVIANKLYSSWSLRPWLVLQVFAIPFDDHVIPMYQDDTKARMLQFGPTGKVPVLVDGDITVWESLAIIEYLADKFPDRAIWPEAADARAMARAVSAEMHAGFQALRVACPMNLTKRFARRDRGEEVAANVARIEALWRQARGRFGAGGPYLFGAFSAADAMYAPIVSRLDTYQFDVAEDTRDYMDTILADPAFVRWRQDALAEPWQIAHYEDGETAVEIFHNPQ